MEKADKLNRLFQSVGMSFHDVLENCGLHTNHIQQVINYLKEKRKEQLKAFKNQVDQELNDYA